MRNKYIVKNWPIVAILLEMTFGLCTRVNYLVDGVYRRNPLFWMNPSVTEGILR